MRISLFLPTIILLVVSPASAAMKEIVVGYSEVLYTESGRGTVNVSGLTPKFTYRFFLSNSKRWDMAFNAFITLIPIATTGTDATVRFLGANARIGYMPKFIKEPWSLSVMSGMAYNSMLVSGLSSPTDTFGYKHALNLQLYPILRRSLRKKHAVFVYLKWVPAGKAGGYNLTYGEKAAGGGFTFQLGRTLGAVISADISNIKLLVEEAQLQSTAFTFNIGVSF